MFMFCKTKNIIQKYFLLVKERNKKINYQFFIKIIKIIGFHPVS